MTALRTTRLVFAGLTWLSTVLLPGAAYAQSAPTSFPWMDRKIEAEKRSELLLKGMSLDEKFEQLVGAPGVVSEIPTCYGARHVPGVARLQIPTLRVTNGPVGIGQNDCVPADVTGLPLSALVNSNSAKATGLPSGMAVAASFDRNVARQFGDVLGVEARNLALHVLEGPGLNLARVPQGGRNFEYFGEDPFLTGTMAVSEIEAIQAHGVIAMAKHFVANEQETNRFTVNEKVEDRVLHELYMLPFEMAIKDGHVASVMCSYNAVNGPHACEDPYTLSDVLRRQWGFKGYVQSDFFAVHSTSLSLLAGMDHEMPGMSIKSANLPVDGPWFTRSNLQAALSARSIVQADIDRALARRYTQMFRLGIFDRPVTQTPINAERDGDIAREISEQSAVLLKNTGHILPLDAQALKTILLVGKAAYADKAVSGCCVGSSDVIALRSVLPLQGLRNSLTGLGSKAAARLIVVADDNRDLAAAVSAARSADAVVVLAGTLSDEGHDLPGTALANGQDAMIGALLAANPRTVVVLKDNASSLLPWIDAAPAVLETWFPGQEDGDALGRLLFGQVTPSGKLPVTFPRSEADSPIRSPRQWPGVDANGRTVPVLQHNNVPTTVEYSEGLKIGYRWFDAERIIPLFPFGYGLSYTSFEVSKVDVTPELTDGRSPIRIRINVKNTGRRRGAEVPQVYLAFSASAGEPPKRLVGFEKVWLEPGKSETVEICIDPLASNHPLGVWDSPSQSWRTLNGDYQLLVGTSAADAALRSTHIIKVDSSARRKDPAAAACRLTVRSP